MLVLVLHACNPATQDAEVGGEGREATFVSTSAGKQSLGLRKEACMFKVNLSFYAMRPDLKTASKNKTYLLFIFRFFLFPNIS